MAQSETAHRSSRLVDNACFGTLQGGLRTDSGRELATHVTEDLGVRRVGFLHYDRPPGITTTADFGVERQRTQSFVQLLKDLDLFETKSKARKTPRKSALGPAMRP